MPTAIPHAIKRCANPGHGNATTAETRTHAAMTACAGQEEQRNEVADETRTPNGGGVTDKRFRLKAELNDRRMTRLSGSVGKAGYLEKRVTSGNESGREKQNQEGESGEPQSMTQYGPPKTPVGN